jgi:hypothetical protein
VAWKTYQRPHQKNAAHHSKVIAIRQHVFVGRSDLAADEMKLGEGQQLAFFAKDQLPLKNIAFGFDQLLLSFFATYAASSSA